MMEKMMGQGQMGDMSGMMAGGSTADMPMMPECLNVMLPYVSREKRTDFAARMVATLMEKSSEGMSEEENKAFMEKLQELIRG